MKIHNSNVLLLHIFYLSIVLIVSYSLWFIYPLNAEVENNFILTNKLKDCSELNHAYNLSILKEEYAYAHAFSSSYDKKYLESAILIDSLTMLPPCNEIDELLSSKSQFSSEKRAKLLNYYQLYKQQKLLFPDATHHNEIEELNKIALLVDEKINAIHWEYLNKDSRFSRGQLEVIKNDFQLIETNYLSHICRKICGCANPQANGFSLDLVSNNIATGIVGESKNFDFNISTYYPFVKNCYFEIKIDDNAPYLSKDYGKIDCLFNSAGIHKIEVKTYFQQLRKMKYDTLHKTFFINVKSK